MPCTVRTVRARWHPQPATLPDHRPLVDVETLRRRRNSLPLCRCDAVFQGWARREAARAGSEACQGCRGRVRERESGGKAHFYIEMGLPSHAALSEAGEWSGVDPAPAGNAPAHQAGGPATNDHNVPCFLCHNTRPSEPPKHHSGPSGHA